MQLRVFAQARFEADKAFTMASQIADELVLHFDQPDAASQIQAANQPGTSSSVVQAVLLEKLTEVGFAHEKEGLFSDYSTAGLRPDYYLPLGGGSGILLEVERGKTTINNMDLLDFWKCHICSAANMLFLFVPTELRQNEFMSPRHEFATVGTRLESFFAPGNETNVEALFLFGY